MKRVLRVLGPLVFLVGITTFPVLGGVETRTLEYSGFTGVKVGYGMHLSVTQAETFKVEVSGDANDLRDLDVTLRGDTLSFGYRFPSNWWGRRGRVTVDIQMPSLKSLDLSGGSQGAIRMHDAGESLDAELSGGSNLAGEVQFAKVRLELSGGSAAGLKGAGDELTLDGSGGSQFRLQDFTGKHVRAELSGGSEASVGINGALDCDLSGGSRLEYYGEATMGDIETSGGSKVRRGN